MKIKSIYSDNYEDCSYFSSLLILQDC